MKDPPRKAETGEELRADAVSGISAALIFLVAEAERCRLHKVASLILKAAKQASLHS